MPLGWSFAPRAMSKHQSPRTRDRDHEMQEVGRDPLAACPQETTYTTMSL